MRLAKTITTARPPITHRTSVRAGEKFIEEDDAEGTRLREFQRMAIDNEERFDADEEERIMARYRELDQATYQVCIAVVAALLSGCAAIFIRERRV